MNDQHASAAGSPSEAVPPERPDPSSPPAPAPAPRPTAPPATGPKRLKLHPALWILTFAGVAANTALALIRAPHDPEEFRIPNVIGCIVSAIVGVPIIFGIAKLVHLLAARRRRPAIITFAVLNVVWALMVAFVCALRGPDIPEGMGAETMPSAFNALVSSEVRDRSAAYQRALQAFVAAGAMDPGTLKSVDDVRARRSLLAAIGEANRGLMGYSDARASRIRELGDQEGVLPGEMEAYLAEFQRTFAMQNVRRLRELDEAFVSKADAVLALYEEHWSEIELTDEGPLLPNQALVERFNELSTEIDRISREQQELQRPQIRP